jgi:hypothetical protein
MDMADALAGSDTDVRPDVVAQRVEPGFNELPAFPDEGHEFSHLVRIHVGEIGAVPERDNQQVARRYRVPVEPGVPDAVRKNNLRSGSLAEDTSGITRVRCVHGFPAGLGIE